MQLTQPYNYKYYWQFRGREISQEFETLIAEHNVVERMDRNLRYANRDRFQGHAFWHASAKVNLPSVINNPFSSSLSLFDQRCSVYGNCLAVLTEMKFPDATNNLTLEFPEGYKRREM